MTRRRLYSTLLVLLTFIAAIVLLRLVWDIAAAFIDLILLLGLAWLIAFILRPIANWLSDGTGARRLVAAVEKRWGQRRAYLVQQALDPIAVTLIYLLLLGVLIVSLIAVIPIVISQARLLILALRDYLVQAPGWIANLQTDLAARLNVPPELVNQFYKPDELGKRLTGVLDAAPRTIANLIRGIASGVGETLLVLALSYYLMLDSRRLLRQIRDLVPKRFLAQYDMTVQSVNRAFGGFLRGQVVMAILSGIVTGLASAVAGVHLSAIVGAIAGLVIFIPLIGAPIAMYLPSIVALLQGLSPLAALLLLVFLTLFQQILLHFVVPRIMSESIGMPSVLTLIAVLVGARLWGVWGFIFGIPVAGAIYTVGLVMLGRFKREQDRLDEQRSSDAL
jgi:predicted PurR-regulated permease PerM